MQRGSFWSAVFTLVAVTIGAGIFGLPFVVAKAGFFTGIFVLVLVGILTAIISLYLGEIVLRTKGKHQLSGLAGIYFGMKGKFLVFGASLLSWYGALFAYILGAGKILTTLWNIDGVFAGWIFWTVLGFLLLFDLKYFIILESILTPLKIVSVLLLSVIVFHFIHGENLSGFSLSKIPIVYGIILFSYLGISAIPEMALELKNKKELKKAILTGIGICAIIYFFYILAFIGAFGMNQEEISLVSLKNINTFLFIFGNVFALLSLSSSFLGLGFSLKDTFILDFKQGKYYSWLYIFGVLAFLLVINIKSFVKVLEFTGVVGGGLCLLMIVVMHSFAQKYGKRKPEFSIKENNFLKYLLFALIFFGIFYELFL